MFFFSLMHIKQFQIHLVNNVERYSTGLSGPQSQFITTFFPLPFLKSRQIYLVSQNMFCDSEKAEYKHEIPRGFGSVQT